MNSRELLPGVTMVTLDNPAELHHTVAAAIGENAPLYAHYHGNARRGYCLTISSSPNLRDAESVIREVRVSGKRYARLIAAEYKATCWNF